MKNGSTAGISFVATSAGAARATAASAVAEASASMPIKTMTDSIRAILDMRLGKLGFETPARRRNAAPGEGVRQVNAAPSRPFIPEQTGWRVQGEDRKVVRPV